MVNNEPVHRITDRSWTDDFDTSAGRLLDGLLSEPDGRISPSVYETSRVCCLSPSLPYQSRRLDFLLTAQHPDGRWGGPEGYALVPTLSAVLALVTAVLGGERAHNETNGEGRLVHAAARGLDVVIGLLERVRSTDLPDTVAVEILLPTLVDGVRKLLPELAAANGLERFATAGFSERLRLPGPIAVAPSWRRAGRLPPQAWHSLEAIEMSGPGRLAAVTPSAGVVCCSPAATVAYLAAGLGSPSQRIECSEFLDRTVQRSGGPVPSVLPITFFERAWVLSALARASMDVTVPGALLADLEAVVRNGPTGGAPGLPADADTTSTVLYVLAAHGRRVDMDILFEFETDDHFQGWPGEGTPSVTANAHVLQALGSHLVRRPTRSPRYQPAIDKVVRWLYERQAPEGCWSDKWHASPLYATGRCALALAAYGATLGGVAAYRAIHWILGSQHADGSWGRWGGTAEETAYAVQTLLLVEDPRTEADRKCAVSRARHVVRWAANPRSTTPLPALWHDKDLYCPIAVVESEIMAAHALMNQQLAQQ